MRRPPPSSGWSRPGSRPSGRRRLSTEPGAGSPGTTEPPERPGAGRLSVDARAAQRERLDVDGTDRYEALLRHLRAGREIPIQPRSRRTFGLDIHPSAGKIVLVAIIAAVVWFAAIAITDFIRYHRVETWDGPDATVQSGLRLAGCPGIVFREDVYFPAWIRFEGRVFRWTDAGAPVGPSSVGAAYPETGYTLGDLELFRIANTIEGQEGQRVMVRQGESPVGAVYVATDCA